METEATPAEAEVSELELVKKCQAGDTDAFDALRPPDSRSPEQPGWLA